MSLNLPPNSYYTNNDLDIYLYHQECIEFMNNLINNYPDIRFDMIFADPPYFLSNDGSTCQSGKRAIVNKGDWDKSKGFDANHEFNYKWLSCCHQLLKPNGTLWITGTHHVIHSVGCIIQQLGMKILNDITWEKPNPPPNLSCRFFTHSTESIIWAAKSPKAKHKFNYTIMREINNHKQMKTVWKMASPSNAEKKFGKHPTQKPLQLLSRIILASTNEGDLILDPFAGAFTTGVAAIPLNRKCIGCEHTVQHLELAVKRVTEAVGNQHSLLDYLG